MIAKNVAQAKWTRKTNKPCGHISPTPLPKPNPAAHKGRNSPYVSNALGRYGRSSERTNEIVRMIAASVIVTMSGHHRRLWMKASLKERGCTARDANPASAPLRKVIKELIKSAATVCRKNRAEPAIVAR